jgi:hypothetical protein
MNVLTSGYNFHHPDSIVVFLFLAGLGPLATIPEVRLDRGTMTLGGVVSGASAILLNPVDATLMGLITGISLARGGLGASRATHPSMQPRTVWPRSSQHISGPEAVFP